MAARVKSFTSMLLLLGVLSILTVSAWGVDTEVTFIFYQALEDGGPLKLVGNTSLLGDWNPERAPYMTETEGSVWILTVNLTAGGPYEVKVWVDHCYCKPNETHVFTVPIEGRHHTEPLPDVYDCNNACPSPPPPPPPVPSPPPPPPPVPSPPPPPPPVPSPPPPPPPVPSPPPPPPPVPSPPPPPPPVPSPPPPPPPVPSPPPPPPPVPSPPPPPPPVPSPPPPPPPVPSPPPPPPPVPSPPPPPPPVPSPPPPPPPVPNITMTLVAYVENRSDLRIPGNGSVFGNWNPDLAVPMHREDGTETWFLEIELPIGTSYEVGLQVGLCPCSRHEYITFNVTQHEIVPMNGFDCTGCQGLDQS